MNKHANKHLLATAAALLCCLSSLAQTTPDDGTAEPSRPLISRKGFSWSVGAESFSSEMAKWNGASLNVGWRLRPGLFLALGATPSSVWSKNKEDYPFAFNSRFFGMPIYAMWKQDFVHLKASPFCQVKIGRMVVDYSWSAHADGKESSNGYYVHFGAGFRYAFKNVPLAVAPFMGFSACGVEALIDNDSCDATEPAGFTFGVSVEF